MVPEVGPLTEGFGQTKGVHWHGCGAQTCVKGLVYWESGTHMAEHISLGVQGLGLTRKAQREWRAQPKWKLKRQNWLRHPSVAPRSPHSLHRSLRPRRTASGTACRTTTACRYQGPAPGSRAGLGRGLAPLSGGRNMRSRRGGAAARRRHDAY